MSGFGDTDIELGRPPEGLGGHDVYTSADGARRDPLGAAQECHSLGRRGRWWDILKRRTRARFGRRNSPGDGENGVPFSSGGPENTHIDVYTNARDYMTKTNLRTKIHTIFIIIFLLSGILGGTSA